jgi:hypothetical protein
MLIIAKQTADELKFILGGDLLNYHAREKFFNCTLAATIVVVDMRMQRFNVYQRGFEKFGTYTVDDIKGNSKNGNNVNIESIIKACQLGNAPSF